jgi:outer membrane murein-binding lipoprotein Lpp
MIGRPAIQIGTRLALVVAVLATCVLLATGCATKKFIKSNVGEVNEKIDTLSKTVEESQERARANEARIGQVGQAAQVVATKTDILEKRIAELTDENRRLSDQLILRDQLPWPPLPPTRRTILPRGLVLKESAESMQAVYDRIAALVRKARLEEWAVYNVGADGFAVVTPIQAIDDAGRPVDKGKTEGLTRWILNLADSLMFAQPGRSRAIVILVTPRAWRSQESEVPSSRIEDLHVKGVHDLSPLVGKAMTTRETKCEALIYEFFRSTDDAPTVWVREGRGRLTATQHLIGAGLWTEQELR